MRQRLRFCAARSCVQPLWRLVSVRRAGGFVSFGQASVRALQGSASRREVFSQMCERLLTDVTKYSHSCATICSHYVRIVCHGCANSVAHNVSISCHGCETIYVRRADACRAWTEGCEVQSVRFGVRPEVSEVGVVTHSVFELRGAKRPKKTPRHDDLEPIMPRVSIFILKFARRLCSLPPPPRRKAPAGHNVRQRPRKTKKTRIQYV